MIDIKYVRNSLGVVSEFSAKGHAGYDEIGKDIVCAGVTAVFLGITKTIEELLMIELDKKIAEDANLFVQFPDYKTLSMDQNKLLKVLAECLIISCREIEIMYGKRYIQLSEIRK